MKHLVLLLGNVAFFSERELTIDDINHLPVDVEKVYFDGCGKYLKIGATFEEFVAQVEHRGGRVYVKYNRPDKEWRLFCFGETIQDGDEYFEHDDDVWVKVEASVGLVYSESLYCEGNFLVRTKRP